MTAMPVRRFLVPALTLVLPILLSGAAALASPSRWAAMQVPLRLGRDDGSVEFFPALVAETPAGFYGDATGSSRFLWIPEVGSTHLLVGVTGSDEIRLGAAGIHLAGLALGVQGWGSASRSETKNQRSQYAPFERESTAQSRLYAGSLGFRAGGLEGAHLDGAVSIASHRNRSGAREVDADSTVLEFRTRPDDAPSWEAAGMLSLPVHGGWVKGFLQGGRTLQREKIETWQAKADPIMRGSGQEQSRIAGDLAWTGPVGQLDLFAFGVSVERTRLKSAEQSLTEPIWTETRSVAAALFAGGEVRLNRWIWLRAGASRAYTDQRTERDRWYQGSGGVWQYIQDLQLASKFGSPSVTVGLGAQYEKISVDAVILTHDLFSTTFSRLSVSYPF